jgi:hypothetical protein
MKVLVACEESQVVCKAFRARGHEAYSCDIQPSSGGHPEWHIQGDAIEAIYTGGWELVIAHPPCTFLSNSGVRWLYNSDGTDNKDRWGKLDDAVEFFNKIKIAAKSIGARYCIENPIPHKHARWIGRYTQIIQPWQFGHTTSKATCLWLYGLPNLKPTKIIPKLERSFEIHKEPPGPNRQRNRSKTFEGIANAMAEQWG